MSRLGNIYNGIIIYKYGNMRKLDDPKIKFCLKLEVRQAVAYGRRTRTMKMTMSISTTK
jgi:hypothetical protein